MVVYFVKLGSFSKLIHVDSITMTSIKIECGCGQRYAFDVEPRDGRMPHTVACPVCGTDGTGAANEVIAQTIQPIEIAASPGGRLHLQQALAEPAVRVAAPA